MMLKGRPVFAMTIGLSESFSLGTTAEPMRKKRWRASKVVRPYSPVRSYWFIGEAAEVGVRLRLAEGVVGRQR